jgi:hypothetical protein
MKVESRIYKGIEYVQFNELPPVQQEKLLQSLGHDFFIKIMIDGKVVSQCLQYKDYCMWFENVYNVHRVLQNRESAPAKDVLSINPNLVLNKV